MSIKDALKATPWRLSATDDTLIVDRDFYEVAQVCGDYKDDWERMEAQARLIAAAPALYAALEAAMPYLEAMFLSDNPVRQAAVRALATARGE